MGMSLMDWFAYKPSCHDDVSDTSETPEPRLVKHIRTVMRMGMSVKKWGLAAHTVSMSGNTATLRLSDAIDEGMTPVELFDQISGMLADVSMLSIPNPDAGGRTQNVVDQRLWQLTAEGLYVRFSEDEREYFFSTESLNVVVQKKPAMMRIEINLSRRNTLIITSPLTSWHGV